MIVAGRVSQKMAPVVRQVYDQMPEPKWVISMGVCASTGGMFNNYAIVQGVDHIIPVDIYLPGCPPRPEMLLNAIIKLHQQIQNMPLGVNRVKAARAAEEAALKATPTHDDEGTAGVTTRQPSHSRGRADEDQPQADRRAVNLPARRTGRPSRSRTACSAPTARRRHHRLRRPGAPGRSSPGDAARPYGGYFDEIADALERALDGGAASFAERSSGSSSTAAR